MTSYRTSIARLLIAMALTIGIALPASALAGKHHGTHCCPQCDNTVCQPIPETIKDERYCWRVECKNICIPRITWPWESCCAPPKCAKVRTVKVLKKIEWECERCGYRWEPKCLDCCPPQK